MAAASSRSSMGRILTLLMPINALASFTLVPKISKSNYYHSQQVLLKYDPIKYSKVKTPRTV